jgi:hypothetical protein
MRAVEDFCESCGQYAPLAADKNGKACCGECRKESDTPSLPFNVTAICSRDGHRWYRTAQDWNLLRCERCKETRRL